MPGGAISADGRKLRRDDDGFIVKRAAVILDLVGQRAHLEIAAGAALRGPTDRPEGVQDRLFAPGQIDGVVDVALCVDLVTLHAARFGVDYWLLDRYRVGDPRVKI